MRSVSASDAEDGLDKLLEAAQRGPIDVRQQDHSVAIVISPQEYERLQRLKADQFNATCDRIAASAQARGLTEEILAEILADGER